MINLEKIQKTLQQQLSEKRYLHSLAVAEEAKKLAKVYHFDEEKAYLAGLLHDVAKEWNEEEKKLWCHKYHLPESYLEKDYQKLLHADLGAIAAKEIYGCDEEICNAIQYHTTGHFPMSLLDKIIFISDKIARDEDIPGLQEEKKLAYINMDQAILCYLEQLEKKLTEKNIPMHQNSLNLLCHLKKNHSK